MIVNINNTLKKESVILSLREELLERGFSPEFAALTLQYAESYFAIDEADGLDITHSPTTAEDVIPSSSRVVA